MFRKWKSDKNSARTITVSTTSKTSAQPKPHIGNISSSNGSNCIDSPKVETLHIEMTGSTEEFPYDPELNYKVINHDNKDMPYGDGSDKVYGMENFGYTCYIASILQALYYTTSFRTEVLAFPPRDPENPRKRKVKVPGLKIHAFTASVQQAQQQGSQQTQNNQSSVNSKMMRNLFGKHSSDSNVVNSSSNSPLNSHDTLNNPDLEKLVVSKYPLFKNMNVNYSLNHQKNITIVGITSDLNANSEQRKRQALISGPIINLDHSYCQSYGMEKNLFTSLKDTFEAMTENISTVGIVSAQSLVDVVKRENEMFRSSMHQDAHEFLNFLINNVIELVDQYSLKNNKKSTIHDIFEGLLTSETKCLSCENVSTRDELFLDLSIDLQQNTSITNCLKMFSQSEMLTESNKFFCENCHSLQEAAKTIKLKKLPRVLALHLKRFKYAEELERNIKLFYRVEYPKTLRIFNTTGDTECSDKLYELYAVVVHIGGGPYHGHYVSLVKTPKFGWLLFDDETVESIDENYVYRFFGDGPGLSTAYLLFYKEVEEEAEFRDRTLFSGLDDACNEDDDIDASAALNDESEEAFNSSTIKEDGQTHNRLSQSLPSSSSQVEPQSQRPSQAILGSKDTAPASTYSQSFSEKSEVSKLNPLSSSSTSVATNQFLNSAATELSCKVGPLPPISTHSSSALVMKEVTPSKRKRMSFSFKKK